MGISYLSVIERYQEHYSVITPLLDALIQSLQAHPQWQNQPHLAFAKLCQHYHFAELCYLLDSNAVQLSANIDNKGNTLHGQGCSRASRPYFTAQQQGQFTLSEPYISLATGNLCVSVMAPCQQGSDNKGYVVVDIHLAQLVEYVMGDRSRSRFSGVFKAGYSVIVMSLFTLVLVLMYTVSMEIWHLLLSLNGDSDPLQPFGIIIFITLALSVFDLGKTILEEEILMHKDIFRHSSTRRTITRFISTILIAISIEALLTMFKASLGQIEYTTAALLMMLSVMGLLIGLGVYVYLGAKAELLLIQAQRAKKGS
ncbi:general glycosylation pathway protein [Pseudoalteromonas ruthenica]|uniref:general glycosylation pathway protein n=1 Tax=Pseudoalteromonas ruthenica TaxID=151081 RepID=UPI00241E1B7A|nr:general glycosylation pathway protein [Pseudoalteromonas ruthenica]|tara:strand:- start:5374 stop:6309 length:936 start_codon:yes stop_codon:yes gene_type:complete